MLVDPIVQKRGAMFRFVLSFLACLFCFGCMSPERVALRQAQLQAALEANKLPAVRLSETQIAKLQEKAPNDQIVWYGAGMQSDGKTFVCLVTGGKNRFGGGGHTQLFAGTFESDGSFQSTLAYLQSERAVLFDCRRRGFEPPVNVCQTISGYCEIKPVSAAARPNPN